MYEVKAKLPPIDGLGDQVLDELVALYEMHNQDCACGLVQGNVLGYVEQDMLSAVTTLLLQHAPSVEVTLATEDEELAFA